MRSKISSVLGAHQDPTQSPRQSLCNYLHSEIEHLEEQDFLAFRNETVKLLSEIQYKAEERERRSQQFNRSSHCPEAMQATAGREYILTTPDTQPVCVPVVQPTQISTTQPATGIGKVQQPPRPASTSPQPASFLVVDDQQPGTSRQLMFTLSPGKTVNHLPLHQDSRETVNTTLLDCQASLEGFQVYYSTSRSTHRNHLHPLNFNQHRHQCHLHSSRTVKTSQPVQPAESAQISRSACIKSHQQALIRATQSFQNNYTAACSSPKQNKAHCPTLTFLPNTYQKLCV